MQSNELSQTFAVCDLECLIWTRALNKFSDVFWIKRKGNGELYKTSAPTGYYDRQRWEFIKRSKILKLFFLGRYLGFFLTFFFAWSKACFISFFLNLTFFNWSKACFLSFFLKTWEGVDLVDIIHIQSILQLRDYNVM